MYQATADIAAAPEEVFVFLTDPERIKLWQPDVIESHPPAGGLRIGARARAVVQEYGRRFSVEFLVVALTANQQLTYDMDAPTVSARIEYRLMHHGVGTHLEQTMTPTFKGFARFLSPCLKGMIQRKMESRLALLRELVEADR